MFFSTFISNFVVFMDHYDESCFMKLNIGAIGSYGAIGSFTSAGELGN